MSLMCAIHFHFVMKYEKVLSLYMATFDIWSIFSNFLLDETIDGCLNRVFQLKLKSTEC